MHVKSFNYLYLSEQFDKMSLSEVSPFFWSASLIFTDSQPKTGTDSVPFYVDFGSKPKRFGRLTVSQVLKNG